MDGISIAFQVAGDGPVDVVVVDVIQDFVMGASPSAEVGRVLATVLCLEVSDDARRRAERLVERFRGTVSPSRAGELIGVFDGPARAVRCGWSIAVEADGTVGVGVHSGECERSFGTVSGVAVDVSRAVARLAGRSQVIVTQTVRDVVLGSAITFDAPLPGALLGLPAHLRAYPVTAI